MERENKELRDRAQRGKSEVGKYKTDNQAMDRKRKEF